MSCIAASDFLHLLTRWRSLCVLICTGTRFEQHLSEGLSAEVRIRTAAEALAEAEQHWPMQPQEHQPSDSEPFAQLADLDQSSSDEDEVMAPDGG